MGEKKRTYQWMANFCQSCSSHPPLSKTPPITVQIVFLHMENLTWRKNKFGYCDRYYGTIYTVPRQGNHQIHPRYVVSSLSFGLWVRLLACHLHFSRFPHRHASTPSTLHHCITTCLACGEDLDPTGSWVFALLRPSLRPVHPHRCLSTLFLPIQPHPT